MQVDIGLGWMPLKTFRPKFRDIQHPQVKTAFRRAQLYFNTTVRKIKVLAFHRSCNS